MPSSHIDRPGAAGGEVYAWLQTGGFFRASDGAFFSDLGGAGGLPIKGDNIGTTAAEDYNAGISPIPAGYTVTGFRGVVGVNELTGADEVSVELWLETVPSFPPSRGRDIVTLSPGTPAQYDVVQVDFSNPMQQTVSANDLDILWLDSSDNASDGGGTARGFSVQGFAILEPG